jgi:hypothetical protein
VKLTFLGTRGYIEARTERHGMHSSMQVAYCGKKVAIDCGEDWLGKVQEWRVRAIVITHAHPDHAWGLKEGAPCPVYATEESWAQMGSFQIEQRRIIAPREPFEIEHITFEAFPVLHSTRAPAVGYRALAGIRAYIGDGATITRSMIRKPEETIIGHVPLRTQLTWCQKEGVSRAIFTQCGTQIVEGDPEAVEAQVRELAGERGVQAEIAYDGMQVILR